MIANGKAVFCSRPIRRPETVPRGAGRHLSKLVHRTFYTKRCIKLVHLHARTALAVEHLHAHGIAHLDISLHNVLVNPTDMVSGVLDTKLDEASILKRTIICPDIICPISTLTLCACGCSVCL